MGVPETKSSLKKVGRMSGRILGWGRDLAKETKIPRGTEPMGICTGTEGGDTPHAGPAPFLFFPRAPDGPYLV